MTTNNDVHELRKNYQTVVLETQTANKDPVVQFKLWFEDALAAKLIEPNAMNLATVDKNGEPSSRMVLLKSFDASGFVFFTNYNSQKAQDLHNTRRAALNFWWDKLYRQVRVCGVAGKISRKDSMAYFQMRPVGSQLGALASQQSRVIASYTVLIKEFRRLAQHYQNQHIPCPQHWGGYRVIPDSFEFWQGRPNRLHDRLRYTKTSTNEWQIVRLSP